jgi:hypothetical protein
MRKASEEDISVICLRSFLSTSTSSCEYAAARSRSTALPSSTRSPSRR